MRIERRFSKGAEVRAVVGGVGAPKIEGYAAVFNEFYVLYEDDGSHFGDNGIRVREIIESGAFSGVMNDDVRCLFNHDADNVLGRSTNGTLSYSQDAKGLPFQNAMDETRIGKDVYAFVKRGDVTGCSFAFIVEEDEVTEEILADGMLQLTRTIKRMGKLFDMGPVTYPAYPQTSVDAREMRAQGDIPEEIMKRIGARKVKPEGRTAEPEVIAPEVLPQGPTDAEIFEAAAKTQQLALESSLN